MTGLLLTHSLEMLNCGIGKAVVVASSRDLQEVLLHAPCLGNCAQCPVRHRAVLYGPVRSRRRGLSLGVNLYPFAKTCSFNCVYCLRGETQVKLAYPCSDAVQVRPELIVKALEQVLPRLEHVDTVDLSGNGEPTLYPHLEELARELHRVCLEHGVRSLGVFTNGTGLLHKNVRRALRFIDHVEVKLDSVYQWKFYVINRPVPGIHIQDILHVLYMVRKEYSLELCVQVMLIETHVGTTVKNFGPEDAELMADVLRKAEPDEIYVYTAYRTPMTRFKVKPAPEEEMRKFASVLEQYGLRVRVFPA